MDFFFFGIVLGLLVFSWWSTGHSSFDFGQWLFGFCSSLSCFFTNLIQGGKGVSYSSMFWVWPRFGSWPLNHWEVILARGILKTSWHSVWKLRTVQLIRASNISIWNDGWDFSSFEKCSLFLLLLHTICQMSIPWRLRGEGGLEAFKDWNAVCIYAHVGSC